MEDKNKKKNNFLKDLMTYGIIILIVVLIRFFIITPVRVKGLSMYPTLNNKDIMLLDKISYRFNDIKRFDIVVVDYNNEELIKRVIGLPSETIEVKDNVLYINGKEQKQAFLKTETDDFEKVTIPEGQYFIMGDNRGNSLDSRIIKSVSRSQIRGKAIFTIFPFSNFGSKK